MAPVTVHGPATCRRGWTQVEIDPQRLDEHAQELFGHLHCVPLAVELHRRTGWPLAMTERRKGPLGNDGEFGWDHVVVRHPDGGLVDIDGHRSAQQLMADRADDGYPGQQRVRDLDGEDALRRVLNVHPAQRPDLTSSAWHSETTSGHDTAQTYLKLLVTPLAETLLRENGLLPPPAATPTPAAAPTTKTATKGHTAMSVDEIRSAIAEVEQRVSTAAHQLHTVRGELDEAAGLLAQLSQGSSAAELSDALGVLRDLSSELDQAGQRAINSGESALAYAGRL